MKDRGDLQTRERKKVLSAFLSSSNATGIIGLR